MRGLDAEQIANAQPNPAELAKMEKFAADADAAAGFAAQGKLVRRPRWSTRNESRSFSSPVSPSPPRAQAQFRLPSFDINSWSTRSRTSARR